MLLELVNNYKIRYEKDIDKVKKAQEFNQQIDTYIELFKNKDKFKNLDIDDFINFLQEIKYTNYPLDNVKTTLIYIKRNNSFDDISCQVFFKNLIQELTYHEITYKENQNLENKILEINKLLNCIINKEFIEINFLIELIKEENLDKDKIYSLMLDVNKHNLEVFNKVNALKEQKEEVKNEIKNVEKCKNIDLLEKYGYKLELKDDLKSLLDNISSKDLEDKLKFFKETLEYSFLKKKKHEDLLITLILYTPYENIENIYKFTKEHDIKLESVFPTFYLNIDFNNLDIDSEFYKNLTGSYEYLFENMKMLGSLGYDIKSVYKEDSIFFMMPSSLVKSNYQNLKKYKITLDKEKISQLKTLTSKNLLEKIDGFIESGLYEYIKEYPTALLYEDKALFYRIHYARKNNLPIKNRYLSSFITSKNGYLINEDNYLEIVKPYISNYYVNDFYKEILNEEIEVSENIKLNALIKLLDENYILEENTYYIANTYVSRQKVLRLFQGLLNRKDKNPNFFEGILFSILNGLILDKDKYDDIVLEVMKLYYLNSYIYKDVAINICKKLGVSLNKIDKEFYNYERVR